MNFAAATNATLSAGAHFGEVVPPEFLLEDQQGVQNFDRRYLEPTHFRTGEVVVEEIDIVFTLRELGIEIRQKNTDGSLLDLYYQDSKVKTCDIRLRIHTIQGDTIIELQKMNGDGLLFNDLFDRFRHFYNKGYPMEEAEPAPLPPALDLPPLDPAETAREWEIVEGYLETSPEEWYRIIANLAMQGVPVPTEILRRLLGRPHDEMNRKYLIAILGSNQDFTGLEVDVKTWLTRFVSHTRAMCARYDQPRVSDSIVLPTVGEIDLQRYCKLIASLRPDFLHDDAGLLLPEIMEILTFASHRSYWPTTRKDALHTLWRFDQPEAEAEAPFVA